MEFETESDLDELLANLEEAKRLSDTLYVPHDKQRAFHSAPNKIRCIFGGNRSGKSEAGVNEARMHSTGEYPDWYPKNLRWMTPTRGRIVVTDYRVAAREVLEPKIHQWFEKEKILKIERTMGNISKVHIQHVTGGVSTFDVLTHEQDTMLHEGWSGHWVWFDEPPPRDKYIACLRGLIDFAGRMWITATPLSEPWLFDEIMTNKARDAWHIAVSIYDNPYLSRKEIDEFIISLTPEEQEARVYGKFMHLSGRVYGEFDSAVHLVKQLPKGHERWPVWFVLDPADRRPHHGVWAKVDPMENLYIFDELVYKGTIKDTSKEILLREKVKHKIRPLDVQRVLDPNKGKTPSQSSGLRLLDEFASHAVYFKADVNDDIALGHLAVKEKLGYDKKLPLSATNHPKLYFVEDSTRECVKQMLSYVWEDWRGVMQGSKSLKEKPKDLNKDMPDCVRYLCMSNPWFYQDEENRAPNTFSRENWTGYGPEQ